MKKFILLGSTAVFLAACSVPMNSLTEQDMTTATERQMAAMFSGAQAFEGALDLETAVERAVFNNLDSRLRTLESGYALGQVRVDSLEMLPNLTAAAGYSKRGTEGYATSQVYGQAGPTGSYSRGSDQENTTTDLTLTWNVLDFALGYFNASQTANRALIAQERERQATYDLVRNAKGSFWRAYAADRMNGKIARAVREGEEVLRQIKDGEANGSIPPAVALSQRRTVLEALRQLEILAQEMNIAQVELAQMINVAPGTKITFATERMTVPSIPGDLATLEQMAFANNPALREQLYRERISADDVRLTAASIFPNIDLSLSAKNNPDSFLLDHAWNETGLNIGLNLMRLATSAVRTNQSKAGLGVEEARSLSVRMAVLAQTNIAYQQYQFSRHQFARASELYDVDRALAEQTNARREASAASGVESVVADTSAILSQLRLYQAYSSLVGAAEAVNASVGNDATIQALQARATEELNVANAELTIAAETIDTLQANDKALTSELRALANELSQANRDLASKVTAFERFDASLKAAMEEVEGQEADERQSAKIASLQEKLAVAIADRDASAKAVAAINAKIAEAQARQADIATQVAAVEAAQAEAEQKIEFFSAQ